MHVPEQLTPKCWIFAEQDGRKAKLCHFTPTTGWTTWTDEEGFSVTPWSGTSLSGRGLKVRGCWRELIAEFFGSRDQTLDTSLLISVFVGLGMTNDEIAESLDTRREVVCLWRRRFFADRLAGLEEHARRGRPRTFSSRSDRSG